MDIVIRITLRSVVFAEIDIDGVKKDVIPIHRGVSYSFEWLIVALMSLFVSLLFKWKCKAS